MLHAAADHQPAPAHRSLSEVEAWRRGSERYDSNEGVWVLQPRPGNGISINASASGLRIAVSCPLRAGEKCMLSMTDRGSAVRLVLVEVVWARPQRDGTIAGVRIIDKQ